MVAVIGRLPDWRFAATRKRLAADMLGMMRASATAANVPPRVKAPRRVAAPTPAQRSTQTARLAVVPPSAATVSRHALTTFGSSEKADHWLSRPNALFGGKTPAQMAAVAPEEVELELVRIDHGVYV